MSSFYIQGGRGYKEGNRFGYNMIPIRTLSPLAYFTHVSIDIAIYVLGNMLVPSRVFWKMDQALVDPSLAHPSRCA
jgi:hypothetical protein